MAITAEVMLIGAGSKQKGTASSPSFCLPSPSVTSIDSTYQEVSWQRRQIEEPKPPYYKLGMWKGDYVGERQ